ncbi:hypothetical protein [Microbispora sp. NBRC 16548]|uniref:hypothetical protein n=1 Tax=Microbispora sp. NBRC 16548 TaxID=3030994 RepID=UPI0024A4C45F|nr:hypothetical protein [Microbispora sp. NBRC 16548]GLX06759.1 hypothetical protein Misp03_36860 [Microbispora sp. NBRC 16548]
MTASTPQNKGPEKQLQRNKALFNDSSVVRASALRNTAVRPIKAVVNLLKPINRRLAQLDLRDRYQLVCIHFIDVPRRVRHAREVLRELIRPCWDCHARPLFESHSPNCQTLWN